MTKELKELVYFGLKAGELVDKLADGFQLVDLAKVLEVAKAAPPALKDAKLALAEYVGMTDEEAADLEAFVVSNFNISEAVVESLVIQVLKTLIELHALISLLKPSQS